MEETEEDTVIEECFVVDIEISPAEHIETLVPSFNEDWIQEQINE
jgi:hypothetical protein